MSDLFAAVCSITSTRRRRFMWAAWWTGAPTRLPFRKPDAYEGGARTQSEAKQKAERAAGVSLVEIDPMWARAWARVLVGEPAWPKVKDPREVGFASSGSQNHEPRRSTTETPREERSKAKTPLSIWSILGVDQYATMVEIKKAYRKRALETHPDHGGSREAFQEVLRAFELATQRRKRPAPKRRSN